MQRLYLQILGIEFRIKNARFKDRAIFLEIQSVSLVGATGFEPATT